MFLTFVYLTLAVALGVGLGVGGLCVAVDLYGSVFGARRYPPDDETAFGRFRRMFAPRRHRGHD